MTVRFDPTRREFIAGSVAALGVAATGLPATVAHAAGVHTFSMGDMALTVLSDGVFDLPTRLLNRDMEPAQIETVLAGALSAPGHVQYDVNVTLVRRGKELILIDAGSMSRLSSLVGRSKTPSDRTVSAMSPMLNV
jgi:hypothetical protein